MHNLVIVGNGFDLAHGLKTGYIDFVKHVINTRSVTPDSYSNLLRTPITTRNRTRFPDYDSLIGSPRNEHNAFFSNLFFKKIFEEVKANWCDVEKLYFQELLGNTAEYSEGRRYSNPFYLNDQFEMVKKELEKYLIEEQERFNPISIYKEFFKAIGQSSSKDLILNFNYTKTVSNYISEDKHVEQIHIHGELDNDQNPIIFGFAANDREARELISKDDNEFMRNIKKHNYKRTGNEIRLINYLNDNKNIDVLILGHSCGISDKLILNQIFNHDNVSSISVFYFESYESYFNGQVNIARIMDNDKNFKRLINYTDCHRMPQFDDSADQQTEFKRYVRRHLQTQKKAKEDEGYLVIT
jgi:hypothetical protein